MPFDCATTTASPPAIEMAAPSATSGLFHIPGAISERSVRPQNDCLGAGARIFTSTPSQPVTASVAPSDNLSIPGNRERTVARFRLLKWLDEDHDHRGASAAVASSVDAAIAFLNSIRSSPLAAATLDDDGFAVIELKDESRDFFADLTFYPDGHLECYVRQQGMRSRSFEGFLTSQDFLADLRKLAMVHI